MRDMQKPNHRFTATRRPHRPRQRGPRRWRTIALHQKRQSNRAPKPHAQLPYVARACARRQLEVEMTRQQRRARLVQRRPHRHILNAIVIARLNVSRALGNTRASGAAADDSSVRTRLRRPRAAGTQAEDDEPRTCSGCAVDESRTTANGRRTKRTSRARRHLRGHGHQGPTSRRRRAATPRGPATRPPPELIRSPGPEEDDERHAVNCKLTSSALKAAPNCKIGPLSRRLHRLADEAGPSAARVQRFACLAGAECAHERASRAGASTCDPGEAFAPLPPRPHGGSRQTPIPAAEALRSTGSSQSLPATRPATRRRRRR